MKYILCLFLFLSTNAFAGKQEIQEKYEEVFLNQIILQKGLGPLSTENKEIIFNSGFLQGLKFSLENFD